jgi:hypothetical protein
MRLPTMVSSPPAKRAAEPTPLTTPRGIGGVRPDGSSVDAIIAAMYQSVSHGPEEEPNWKRMSEIFMRTGVLIPPKRPDAEEHAVLDVDAFRDRVRKGMAAAKERGDSTAFFESEVARKADCFGNVCQVFSTYEGRHAPGDEKPVRARHQRDPAREGWQALVDLVGRVGHGEAGPADPDGVREEVGRAFGTVVGAVPDPAPSRRNIGRVSPS